LALVIWQALWRAIVRWGIMRHADDVPLDALAGIVHWLQKEGNKPGTQLLKLDMLRKIARDGGPYCRNEGCEVLGHRKDFKVCPQCKNARYCGAACQKADWTTGGHREKCGKCIIFSEVK
jgi:hypothetical protein